MNKQKYKKEQAVRFFFYILKNKFKDIGIYIIEEKQSGAVEA